MSLLPALNILSPKEAPAVQLFVRRLQEALGPTVRQIILFGSRARGDSQPDSDIDILIVVQQESWPIRDQISLIAARVSLEHNVLLSPRVVSDERWQQMSRERFSLYQNVARDGIPLQTGDSHYRQ